MQAFFGFVEQRKNDLRRIARGTRGECTYEDVVNEAWLMAQTLSARSGNGLDFSDAIFQQTLLSHLYQHLVRYTEVNVRYAIRLDHNPSSDATSGVAHPLMNSLSDQSGDSLALLLDDEQRPAPPTRANAQHSVASVYLILLEHFDKRMRSVANFLLISSSQAYRCCAKARHLTRSQHALLLPPPVTIGVLKPWRRQRHLRVPRQMQFDFDDTLQFMERERSEVQ